MYGVFADMSCPIRGAFLSVKWAQGERLQNPRCHPWWAKLPGKNHQPWWRTWCQMTWVFSKFSGKIHCKNWVDIDFEWNSTLMLQDCQMSWMENQPEYPPIDVALWPANGDDPITGNPRMSESFVVLNYISPTNAPVFLLIYLHDWVILKAVPLGTSSSTMEVPWLGLSWPGWASWPRNL